MAILANRTVLAGLPLVSRWDQTVREASSTSLLTFIAIVIGILTLIKLIYFFLMHQFTLNTVHAIRVRLAKWIFDSYLHAPWTFHLDHHSSELLRNSTTEVNETVSGVILPILTIIFGFVMALFVLCLIVTTLPLEAFLAFGATIIAAGLLLFGLRKLLAREGEAAKDGRLKMLKHVNEGLSSIVDARLFGLEPWFLDRFLEGTRRLSIAQNRMTLVSRLMPYAIELVSVVGLLLVVLLLARRSDSLAEVLPQMTLIAIGLVRLRQAVNQVASGVARVQYSLPSLANVYEHTAGLKEAVEDVGLSKDRIAFEDAITCEQVWFHYASREAAILKGIDLRIPKGSSVAFVGETGCGKTTLLQLLLSLMPPAHGSIKVDGVEVQSDLRRWRNLIGYVPQHIHLLDATISENIALGDAVVDERRLMQAVKIAQLEEVIASQPDGLRTMIGENGTRLSGGQRQRLGLARALYREPSVILLDEATSALDHQTESAITKALNEIPWDATRIIVAHRLSTVQNCEIVFMFKDGEVFDQGSFDELCQRHTTLAAGMGTGSS
jgi:ABC-type bacteriocin/lantibiotic exporter with double-glycine peptidase domain